MSTSNFQWRHDGLIAMSSVPSRIREGMLLLSGDVLLLFNPLQIDFSGRGAGTALS